MIEYALKSFSTFLIGFIPFAEIYVAVPAGFAVGLDPLSVVFWSVLGNFLPVVLIHFFHEQLLRLPRLGPWLGRLASPKVKEKLDRHGFWFVVVSAPWIGVWAVAATLKVLNMDARVLLTATFAGVAGYAVVLAGLIMAGIEAFGGQG